MKPEHEEHLRTQIAGGRTPREVIADMVGHGMIESPKQAWRTLEKWERRRLYEYGVCIDLGWLTPPG